MLNIRHSVAIPFRSHHFLSSNPDSTTTQPRVRKWIAKPPIRGRNNEFSKLGLASPHDLLMHSWLLFTSPSLATDIRRTFSRRAASKYFQRSYIALHIRKVIREASKWPSQSKLESRNRFTQLKVEFSMNFKWRKKPNSVKKRYLYSVRDLFRVNGRSIVRSSVVAFYLIASGNICKASWRCKGMQFLEHNSWSSLHPKDESE